MIDLVEYLEQYVDLTEVTDSAGKVTRYQGLCPFHNDSSPSFVVYPNAEDTKYNKPVCLCFTCHPNPMDVIDFAKKFHKITFAEARKLVDGVVNPVDRVISDIKKERKGDRYFEVSDLQVAKKLRRLYMSMEFDKVEDIERKIQGLPNKEAIKVLDAYR